MAINIIAVYDQEGIARQAIDDLIGAGCQRSDVTFVEPHQGQLSEQLNSWGIAGQDAETYSRAVERGKALVRARVADEQGDRVAGILVQRGARKLSDIRNELQSASGLRTAKEEISVGKRQESSRVEARTEVTEQPVERKVTLREENVRADTRPADRPLSPQEADEVFKEGSVEMTEMREVPEVSKQARVTQEVNLKKESGLREGTVRDTVRRSDVHIERKE